MRSILWLQFSFCTAGIQFVNWSPAKPVWEMSFAARDDLGAAHTEDERNSYAAGRY
jgi:hypothetical protein